jgi:tetratricopeptide (TPR) repeat protein
LNALQPEFVMSVGDLIETWDEEEDVRLNDPDRIESLWAEFFDIVSDLEMPFFGVGGNNGLGNALLEGMWRERFGYTYYSFSYHDVLFIALSSDDPPGSSYGRMSDTQIDWLSATLERQRDARWTFLFLHRPLWIDNPSEWQPVEEVLGDRQRTVFAGHHHVFKVTTIDGFSYYSLATTGGVSSLSGPADGEFDHLVWVTMTDDGPRIANLMQDGVWGDNPVEEAVGEFELTTVIRQRGVAAALVEYERLRRVDPTRVMFNDEPMTVLGYDLMSQGQLDAAQQVLVLNAQTYEASSGAHGALAEVYYHLGEREKALGSCRTALELNPENVYAADLMAQISSEDKAAEGSGGG